MIKLKGFTVLEIIVVMGILAVLATISVYGLVALRHSINIQQAHGEFISILRQVQNLSRNSVSSQALIALRGDPLLAQVDGYAISFDSTSNYSIRYCLVSGANIDCRNVEQANVKSNSYKDISVYPFGTNNCKVIYVARLTGDISGLTSDLAPVNDTTVCTVRVTNNVTGNFKTLVVDFAGNSIKVN